LCSRHPHGIKPLPILLQAAPSVRSASSTLFSRASGRVSRPERLPRPAHCHEFGLLSYEDRKDFAGKLAQFGVDVLAAAIGAAFEVAISGECFWF